MIFYAAITDATEGVPTFEAYLPGARYLCFTDVMESMPPPWVRVPLPTYFKNPEFTRAFVAVNAAQLFPGESPAIWVGPISTQRVRFSATRALPSSVAAAMRPRSGRVNSILCHAKSRAQGQVGSRGFLSGKSHGSSHFTTSLIPTSQNSRPDGGVRWRPSRPTMGSARSRRPRSSHACLDCPPHTPARPSVYPNNGRPRRCACYSN